MYIINAIIMRVKVENRHTLQKKKNKKKTTKTITTYHFTLTRLQRFRGFTIITTKCHKSTEENPQKKTPNNCYRSGDF